MNFRIEDINGELFGFAPIPEVIPSSPLSPSEFASRLAQSLMDYPEVGKIDTNNNKDDPQINIVFSPGERKRKDPHATWQTFTEAVGIIATEHIFPPLSKKGVALTKYGNY